ncbi:8452_t:CDS:2 [Ambispora leptoticha]|uniref:8452_t:CDS:1 n=1 Tax=Ambispora leptoticha TaxID=144679 RepID=A0A9N8VU47_9GLOM|nr:8452_t:CDS:2 [Ambispora leptoticha]
MNAANSDNNENTNKITGPWSKEEDDLLLELIGKIGHKNWKAIGNKHGRRNGKQCRERWTNHLDPKCKYSKSKNQKKHHDINDDDNNNKQKKQSKRKRNNNGINPNPAKRLQSSEKKVQVHDDVKVRDDVSNSSSLEVFPNIEAQAHDDISTPSILKAFADIATSPHNREGKMSINPHNSDKMSIGWITEPQNNEH